MFDYRDDDNRNFFGCFWLVNNGYLNKISLVVPFFDNDITVLINIHEYIHGIMLYEKLGKKYKPGIDIEILPMLYEKLYVLENSNNELIQFEDSLNQKINDSNELKYKLGLMCSDKLLQMYYAGKNFKQLDRRDNILSKINRRKFNDK